MTLKDFANVDSFYRDKSTRETVEWHDYMARVIGKLGLENIKPYIPFDLNLVREKLKTDEHLNNLRLKDWDNAGYALIAFLACKGITTQSASERVCILKEAARMLAREIKE